MIQPLGGVHVLLLLLLLLFLAWTPPSIAIREVEIKNDGMIPDGGGDVSASITDSFSVAINNKVDEKITIYWYDSKKDVNAEKGHYMMDLSAGQRGNLNTFHGHSFFATKNPKPNEKGADTALLSDSIYHFTVQFSKTEYYIGFQSEEEAKKYKPIKVTPSIETRSLNPDGDPTIRKLNIKKNNLQHPLVLTMEGEKIDSSVMMNAKFRSLSPRKVDMWYDDGKDGTPQGTLSTGQESTTNTFIGHQFYVTVHGDRSKEIARFTMEKNRVLYVIYDTKEHPPPDDLLLRTHKEIDFMENYLATYGIRWRHYYGPNGPRPPPILFQWPAPEIGAVHEVITPQSYWHCSGSQITCQGKEPVTLHLEVVSQEPRVFVIPNFLSNFEADTIIEHARPKIDVSQVGNYDAGGARVSSTRTSRNAWVQRKSSDVTETLFKRAADTLNLDENILHTNRNAEDMQVVYYQLNQKYDSHHDWGVSGYNESRFITMLLYLTDGVPTGGGETAFPKARNGAGMKVKPAKGTAVLFYNLLEDGNGDDLALHAALPVTKGEKWLANFWVWDAKRKG